MEICAYVLVLVDARKRQTNVVMFANEKNTPSTFKTIYYISIDTQFYREGKLIQISNKCSLKRHILRLTRTQHTAVTYKTTQTYLWYLISVSISSRFLGVLPERIRWTNVIARASPTVKTCTTKHSKPYRRVNIKVTAALAETHAGIYMTDASTQTLAGGNCIGTRDWIMRLTDWSD